MCTECKCDACCQHRVRTEERLTALENGLKQALAMGRVGMKRYAARELQEAAAESRGRLGQCSKCGVILNQSAVGARCGLDWGSGNCDGLIEYRQATCEVCGLHGYVWSQTSDPKHAPVEIQKCDLCGRHKTDDAAAIAFVRGLERGDGRAVECAVAVLEQCGREVERSLRILYNRDPVYRRSRAKLRRILCTVRFQR